MATAPLEPEAESPPPGPSVFKLPKLRWTQIIAISIFWFALNFHWAALGFIILPSQVLKIVGELHKGQELAFVLVPGAFVALVSNPLIGMLSDRTRGRLAIWGRRRPYIVLGTLVNVCALVWMANAWDIPSLTLAFLVVQFSNNAASAPFHALLPDLVPPEQRGIASGVMGTLSIGGTICGVAVAGLFVNANQPLLTYQHNLALTYGITIAVLLGLMLITIFSVNEGKGTSAHMAEEELAAAMRSSGGAAMKPVARRSWLTRALLYNVVGIIAAVLVIWGGISMWNMFHPGGIQVQSDMQQGILMVVIALGVLRLFDFDPRRDPDFAWVLITRLLMMLGIYTIQTFLQYYMRDVIGVPDPEQETTKFVIIASLASLVSAVFAGWLSDHVGRKRVIYLSGGTLGMLGLVLIVVQMFTHSLTIMFVAGFFFGIGAGAYQSVDWALVADVLPSHKNFAKDMGVWNISLSLPQVIAPILGGPLIDAFTQRGMPVVGFQVLFAIAVVYCLLGTVTVRFIHGVKR